MEDERVPLQQRLDARTLVTAAAAVNQADFAQTRGVRRGQVFVDERRDVSWRETVKVEKRFDWEFDCFRSVRSVRIVIPIHGHARITRRRPAPCRSPGPAS